MDIPPEETYIEEPSTIAAILEPEIDMAEMEAKPVQGEQVPYPPVEETNIMELKPILKPSEPEVITSEVEDVPVQG